MNAFRAASYKVIDSDEDDGEIIDDDSIEDKSTSDMMKHL